MANANDRAESWNYLYEKLGEKRFQELCASLLTVEFPDQDVSCYPVGQRDGGRDIVGRGDNELVIYQVKWSAVSIKDPVQWISNAIRKESSNIKRLVKAGASKYIILTCVTGSGDYSRGMIDRLERKLDELRESYGIPIVCWWRPDIDARVSKAPTELKWAFSEMLAGPELIRYLVWADQVESRDQAVRNLILRFVATQKQEDARVKFKRVELDGFGLSDLFVDVEATRVAAPPPKTSSGIDALDLIELGGAANYLLSTDEQFTYVTGEPGQGKSTLAQYVSQAYRDRLIPGEGNSEQDHLTGVRIPLRVDLRDFSLWLTGADPFSDHDDYEAKPLSWVRKKYSLEQFIANLVSARSGGSECTVTIINDIFSRFPVIVVLDGLDEIGRQDLRSKIVTEIDEFSSRLGANQPRSQLVVTSRPSAASLPEPSWNTFEKISLTRLSPELRTAYLRKWMRANGITGIERRKLEKTFRDRTTEPHIALLADNPMQLSILLYLLHKRGDSVPTDRTGLYSSYMETLLDREGEKTRAIIDHRPELEEVTAYLGWHLQSIAEAQGGAGRLHRKELRKAILNYLFEADRKTDLVDALFTAVTDRVWALTSKYQGTFEFDVQPLREYFAAKYLHDFAGADSVDFDSADVLRALIRRPYWLNTCRFYVGFATPNELAGLVSGIAAEFDSLDLPRQVRTATWVLLSDGVFAGRIRAQREAVRLLTDDLSLLFIHEDLIHNSEPSIPTWDRGGKNLVEKLQADIEANPSSTLNKSRIHIMGSVLSGNLNELFSWWLSGIRAALEIGDGESVWVQIGSALGILGELQEVEIARLVDSNPERLPELLAGGAVATRDSALEDQFVASFVHGSAVDFNIAGCGGYTGDLLKVLSPIILLEKAYPEALNNLAAFGHASYVPREAERSAALSRLKARDERFKRVQSALRFNRGQKGTTFPWANTSREVSRIFGPCWLAAEIAIIGAAADPQQFSTAGVQDAGAVPLGVDPDYGLLLVELRKKCADGGWWDALHDNYEDDLSRSTWALSFLAIADERVVTASRIAKLTGVVDHVTAHRRNALIHSSSRLGAAGFGRRLSNSVLNETSETNVTVKVLLAHHIGVPGRLDWLSPFGESDLLHMGVLGAWAWPAYQRLVTTLAEQDASEEVLRGLRGFDHGCSAKFIKNFRNADHLAARVLSDPSSYPATLVSAVEHVSSRSRKAESLLAVAQGYSWFGE